MRGKGAGSLHGESGNDALDSPEGLSANDTPDMAPGTHQDNPTERTIIGFP